MSAISRRRLGGLMAKESRQILRDPSSVMIAFVMPMILLVLFGYGVSLDAEHVPIAVVDEQPSQDSTAFTQAFFASPLFRAQAYPNSRTAERALLRGEVDGIVVLRADFARRLASPEGAPVQAIVNGTNAGIARIVLGYIDGVWASWLVQRGHRTGQALVAPVALEARIWFNPAVQSRNFIVPGLIAIIITLIGALLTSLIIAREWERGTMEALLASPVTVSELLLGKLIPYFVLGMGSVGLVVAIAVGVFGVPLRGSTLVLFATSAAFLIAALTMGLLISSVARSQFVAAMVAVVTTFLPAFLLSGFIFEIGSMPAAIQYVTYLVVARYFIEILQTLFLVGTVWSVILPNLAAILAFATVFLALTVRRTAKRLD